MIALTQPRITREDGFGIRLSRLTPTVYPSPNYHDKVWNLRRATFSRLLQVEALDFALCVFHIRPDWRAPQ